MTTMTDDQPPAVVATGDWNDERRRRNNRLIGLVILAGVAAMTIFWGCLQYFYFPPARQSELFREYYRTKETSAAQNKFRKYAETDPADQTDDLKSSDAKLGPSRSAARE